MAGFLSPRQSTNMSTLTCTRRFQSGYIIKYSELNGSSRPATSNIRSCAPHELGRHGRPYRDRQYGEHSGWTASGSSGSFTTALPALLHTRQRNVISPMRSPSQACHVEIDLLCEPVGEADQFISAYGGAPVSIQQDDSVAVAAASISHEVARQPRRRPLSFLHRLHRSALGYLKAKMTNRRQKNGSVIDDLHYIKDIGRRSTAAASASDLRALLGSWTSIGRRRKSVGRYVDSQIDTWYDTAMRNGALGAS